MAFHRRRALPAQLGRGYAPEADRRPDPLVADRRPIPNLVVEARKYSALAIDTLVELPRIGTRIPRVTTAATALLDRGYGRPAQSLDLHFSADAITKRLSAICPTLNSSPSRQRMVAAAPIVLEATAEVSDDASELPDGDAEDSPPDALA